MYGVPELISWCSHDLSMDCAITINLNKDSIVTDTYFNVVESDGCMMHSTNYDGKSKESISEIFEKTKLNPLLEEYTFDSTNNSKIFLDLNPNSNINSINEFISSTNKNINLYFILKLFISKYCEGPCCYDEVLVGNKNSHEVFQTPNTSDGLLMAKNSIFNAAKKLPNSIVNSINPFMEVISSSLKINGFTLNNSNLKDALNTVIKNIKNEINCHHSKNGPCGDCVNINVFNSPINDQTNKVSLSDYYNNRYGNTNINLFNKKYYINPYITYINNNQIRYPKGISSKV
jgi:hypothetical protein